MAVLIRLLFVATLALGLTMAPAWAVFGGKTAGANDVVARTVAAILYSDDKGTHLCSATLLGPRLLVTAAHCTDGGKDGTRVIFSTTLTDVPAVRLRNVVAISRAKPTPEAKGTYAYNNPDDIALIVIDSPAPADTTSALLTSHDGIGSVGIAGYGATSDLRNAGFAKAQQGFDRTLRIAATSLTPKGAVLTADQTKGAGMCTGDSGGPAFTLDHKRLILAGVLIGVSSPKSQNDYCRGSAHFASIPRWRDWIIDTAKALGQALTP